MLAAGWLEKPCYGWKNSLVVGGTRTRVLADSVTVAASTLTIAPTRPTYQSSYKKSLFTITVYNMHIYMRKRHFIGLSWCNGKCVSSNNHHICNELGSRLIWTYCQSVSRYFHNLLILCQLTRNQLFECCTCHEWKRNVMNSRWQLKSCLYS